MKVGTGQRGCARKGGDIWGTQGAGGRKQESRGEKMGFHEHPTFDLVREDEWAWTEGLLRASLCSHSCSQLSLGLIYTCISETDCPFMKVSSVSMFGLAVYFIPVLTDLTILKLLRFSFRPGLLQGYFLLLMSGQQRRSHSIF